jgi:hypothetical protein
LCTSSSRATNKRIASNCRNQSRNSHYYMKTFKIMNYFYKDIERIYRNANTFLGNDTCYKCDVGGLTTIMAFRKDPKCYHCQDPEPSEIPNDSDDSWLIQKHMIFNRIQASLD